jgi:hypothetical protein
MNIFSRIVPGANRVRKVFSLFAPAELIIVSKMLQTVHAVSVRI